MSSPPENVQRDRRTESIARRARESGCLAQSARVGRVRHHPGARRAGARAPSVRREAEDARRSHYAEVQSRPLLGGNGKISIGKAARAGCFWPGVRPATVTAVVQPAGTNVYLRVRGEVPPAAVCMSLFLLPCRSGRIGRCGRHPDEYFGCPSRRLTSSTSGRRYPC
jgi:hypothetical protein